MSHKEDNKNRQQWVSTCFTQQATIIEHFPSPLPHHFLYSSLVNIKCLSSCIECLLLFAASKSKEQKPFLYVINCLHKPRGKKRKTNSNTSRSAHSGQFREVSCTQPYLDQQVTRHNFTAALGLARAYKYNYILYAETEQSR